MNNPQIQIPSIYEMPPIENRLRVVGLHDFLAMELPKPEYILSPWLPKSGLAMIHARPGIGKTHLSFGIAYAVATGGEFLKWKAEKPRGVLLLDGEMPATVAQQRLAAINMMHGHHSLPAKLNILTPDLQNLGMPDLADPEGQKEINAHITDDIELVIVDNLSCLVRSGKENESESWLPVQNWALNLRARGKSVLFIHHSGKAGAQRGSSKKEDVLDTVISLRRPDSYTPDKGAQFIVSYEKSRGFHGEEAEPFEATLLTDENGKQFWSIKSVEESTYEKVVKLFNEGMSQTEIATEISIHKSNVSRYITRAREENLLTIRSPFDEQTK